MCGTLKLTKPKPKPFDHSSRRSRNSSGNSSSGSNGTQYWAPYDKALYKSTSVFTLPYLLGKEDLMLGPLSSMRSQRRQLLGDLTRYSKSLLELIRLAEDHAAYRCFICWVAYACQMTVMPWWSVVVEVVAAAAAEVWIFELVSEFWCVLLLALVVGVVCAWWSRQPAMDEFHSCSFLS